MSQPPPAPSTLPKPPVNTSAPAVAGQHLLNGPVQVVALRDYARNALVDLLEEHRPPTPVVINDTKKPTQQSVGPPQQQKLSLVLDRSLSGPLGLIAEVDILKRHGVDSIHHLLPQPLLTDASTVIYLIRSQSLQLFNAVLTHVKHWQQQKPVQYKQIHIYCVPRHTLLIDKYLQSIQLTPTLYNLTIHTYPLTLIPLETDLLSLENPTFYHDVYAVGDTSQLSTVVTALLQLQQLYGRFSSVKGKGQYAWQVWKLFEQEEKKYERESGGKQAYTQSLGDLGVIDEVILLDRQLDFYTPMLTPLTYEALIDEVYGIQHGYVEVDAEIMGKQPAPKPTEASDNETAKQQQAAKRKLLLNRGDVIYDEIRSLHFRTLGPILHHKAQSIAATYKQRHDAVSVSEMHNFMQKFKTAHTEHTLLQTHINLAERLSQWTRTATFDKRIDYERMIVSQSVEDMAVIDEYIDTLVTRRVPINNVLRLLSLLSLTEQLRQRRYEEIKRNIVGSYGYGASIYRLLALEQHQLIGFPSSAARRRNYSALSRELKLITPNPSITNPTDLTYLYNGYAPITARCLELAAQRGWQQIQSIWNLLPGKTFDIHRDAASTVEIPVAPPVTGLSSPNTSSHAASPSPTPQSQPTTIKSSTLSQSSSMGTLSRSKRKRTCLVFYIGGVTSTEVSALRFLSSKSVSEHDRTYIVATTKLINANHVLDAYQQLP